MSDLRPPPEDKDWLEMERCAMPDAALFLTPLVVALIAVVIFLFSHLR
jgi:hypothetical protein